LITLDGKWECGVSGFCVLIFWRVVDPSVWGVSLAHPRASERGGVMGMINDLEVKVFWPT
jgi:hypothetical protein